MLRYLYPLGEERVSNTPTALCCTEPRSRPRNRDLRFHENHHSARKSASVSAIESISPKQKASSCFHISQVLENGQIGSHSCSLCFSKTQLPLIRKRNNDKTWSDLLGAKSNKVIKVLKCGLITKLCPFLWVDNALGQVSRLRDGYKGGEC